jgi:hypothetical protein
MWFVPGSHKLGPLNPVDLGNTTADGPLSLLPEPFRTARPAAVELSPGSCTFHNGLTFHYAGPNLTDIPRRAMVTIFIPAGTTYRRHEHLVGDRANLLPGEEFHGPLSDPGQGMNWERGAEVRPVARDAGRNLTFSMIFCHRTTGGTSCHREP